MFFGFGVGELLAEMVAVLTWAKLVGCSVVALLTSAVAVFVFHI